MKLIKFESGEFKHKGEPLFINPEMVVAIDDDTTYYEDRDGNATAPDGYITKVYVSLGWGCNCNPCFKVIGKYDDVASKLMNG